MNTAEKIYQEVCSLPEPDVKEVLDFVEFLKNKRQRELEDRRLGALAVLEKYKGRYDDSAFKRDDLYDRPSLR
jgi:hypothetical protein